MGGAELGEEFEQDDDSVVVGFRWNPDIMREFIVHFGPPIFSPEAKSLVSGLFFAWAVIAGVSVIAAPWLNDLMWYFAAMAVLGFAVLVGWQLVVRHQLQRSSMRDDPRHANNVLVRIDPYGVTLATDISQDFLSWLGVKKVEVFATGVFFRSGVHHGVYVPRVAFQSDDAFTDFCAQIRRYQTMKLPPPHMGHQGAPDDEPPKRVN